VPADRAAEPVRRFGTWTPDRDAVAEGLAAGPIETVAMESTGGYWLPVDARLAAPGCRVHLVHARHLQPGPGRQSAGQDGQWLQDVPTCGLLRGSCRPAAEMCAGRASWRHRATWLEQRPAPSQHRQKALQPMHVPLPQVLPDMTGPTGLAIIRALVGGARGTRFSWRAGGIGMVRAVRRRSPRR
jgi:hypothetical protein